MSGQTSTHYTSSPIIGQSVSYVFKGRRQSPFSYKCVCEKIPWASSSLSSIALNVSTVCRINLSSSKQSMPTWYSSFLFARPVHGSIWDNIHTARAAFRARCALQTCNFSMLLRVCNHRCHFRGHVGFCPIIQKKHTFQEVEAIFQKKTFENYPTILNLCYTVLNLYSTCFKRKLLWLV